MFGLLCTARLPVQRAPVYARRVLSLLALACWFSGLILLQISPALGAGVAAAGFVFAGKAVRRPDDMATMFGVLFFVVILINLVRFVAWLIS